MKINKITFKTFMVIAVPLALQNLMMTSVNLVDNLMIGALGDTAIATVNLANQFSLSPVYFHKKFKAK